MARTRKNVEVKATTSPQARLIKKDDIRDYFNEEARRRERREKIERERREREEIRRAMVREVIERRERRGEQARARWRMMWQGQAEQGVSL